MSHSDRILVLLAILAFHAPLSPAVAQTSRLPPLVLEPSPPGQRPANLLMETFEDAASLKTWKRIDGVVTGVGEESRVSLDHGALRLDAGAETRHWRAMTRTVQLGGVSWVRFAARMRTRDVDRSRARYANCNLFLRFSSGGIQGTHILVGTNPWMEVARRVRVPPGAQEATLGCFLSMPGVAWFDDVRLDEVAAPAWRTLQSGSFVYHWLPGDGIPADARAYNEDSVAKVAAFLKVTAVAPVEYYKYPDRRMKEELTGDPGNAFNNAEAREIHTLWARDRHEIVHILAHPLGRPPALLAEGLAVYLSGSWQNRPVNEFARTIDQNGKWIPLARLVDTRAFRLHDDLVTYAEAGALVGWLATMQSRDVLFDLYLHLDAGRPGGWNRAEFEKRLGSSMDDLDEAFRRWLHD